MHQGAGGRFHFGHLLRSFHAGWFLLGPQDKMKLTMVFDATNEFREYERIMQGSEGNWQKVSSAGKEDVLALANFALVKAEQLAVAVMEMKEKVQNVEE